MASNTRVVTVTDAPTQLDGVTGDTYRSMTAISVCNNGSATVYLGGADVTAATGVLPFIDIDPA